MDGFGDFRIGLSWFYFVLITLFINIILLNLLISIISDTFAKFKENYNIIMYKDILYLILENRYLFLGRDLTKLNKYLVVSDIEALSSEA